MSIKLNESSFIVNVVGDVTGEQWHGSFKTRLCLSHRDYLRQDQIRRELLGANSAGASDRAQDSANIFSMLAVNLVEFPGWWKESEGGLGLQDDNLIASIYEGVLKAKAEAAAERQKRAESAKTELGKIENK